MKIRTAIRGMGGQGTKKLATIIMDSILLDHPNWSVALSQTYDTMARGGISNTYLILSDSQIRNPVPEETDIVIDINLGSILLLETELWPKTLKLKNQYRGIFLLGVLTAHYSLLRKENIEKVLREKFNGDQLAKNLSAFESGIKAK